MVNWYMMGVWMGEGGRSQHTIFLPHFLGQKSACTFFLSSKSAFTIVILTIKFCIQDKNRPKISIKIVLKPKVSFFGGISGLYRGFQKKWDNIVLLCFVSTKLSIKFMHSDNFKGK